VMGAHGAVTREKLFWNDRKNYSGMKSRKQKENHTVRISSIMTLKQNG
jgi:hypothetical protein